MLPFSQPNPEMSTPKMTVNFLQIKKNNQKFSETLKKNHGMMNFREDCGPIFILRNNTHTSPFLVLKDHVSVALISCYCGPGIDFWRKKMGERICHVDMFSKIDTSTDASSTCKTCELMVCLKINSRIHVYKCA